MNDLFEAVFEQWPEPAGLLADGELVAVNAAWERVLGWPRGEAVGKSAAQLGTWAVEEDRTRALAQLERDGRFAGAVSVRTRDGRVFEAELALGRLVHGPATMTWFRLRDLTEQTRQHEELLLNEARLRALGMATFEGLAMSENGIVIDCNEQLAELLGHTVEQLRGMSITSLVAPASRARVESALTSSSEGPYEHVALRKDGTTIPIEVRARMVRHGDRSIRLSAIRDLSEQKRQEREQQRLISELRARNTEMEQFVHTVSHDLKSPLVTIKGFVGAIAAALDANRLDHVRGDLGRIDRAADRMTELLEDLLELSRVGRIATITSNVPLGEVARGAVELVQGAADARGVTIVVGELPVVTGDRGRLLQVLQNLLENAIKYLGDQPQPRVEIGARDVPGRAIFYVRDNGKGIAPEHAERVFGLFEKLDPRSPGTGVGLALVQRIVASHHGKVWVESEGPGRGCTFVVDIPLELAAAP